MPAQRNADDVERTLWRVVRSIALRTLGVAGGLLAAGSAASSGRAEAAPPAVDPPPELSQAELAEETQDVVAVIDGPDPIAAAPAPPVTLDDAGELVPEADGAALPAADVTDAVVPPAVVAVEDAIGVAEDVARDVAEVVESASEALAPVADAGGELVQGPAHAAPRPLDLGMPDARLGARVAAAGMSSVDAGAPAATGVLSSPSRSAAAALAGASSTTAAGQPPLTTDTPNPSNAPQAPDRTATEAWVVARAGATPHPTTPLGPTYPAATGSPSPTTVRVGHTDPPIFHAIVPSGARAPPGWTTSGLLSPQPDASNLRADRMERPG
jgi:hypothetical protein